MAIHDDMLHAQLVQRRQRLENAVQRSGTGYLNELLKEVDSALDRMEKGTYGLCESCHEPVEAARLMADPLVRYCLDHLTAAQQQALQQDLEMAARIQAGLLPKQNLRAGEWEACYHYEALGPVSGDYCDLVASDGSLLFLLGDVAGKGVAASMLMAHLHAIFHSLIATGLPVGELMDRANRVFCESTLAQHFATLVCGKAGPAGEIEFCNAGHCPPLRIGRSGVAAVEPSGLPLGLFSNNQYKPERLRLEPGDTLFLYTDGLSEAGAAEREYGAARLSTLLHQCRESSAAEMVSSCVTDLGAFLAGGPKNDDLTVLAIRRVR